MKTKFFTLILAFAASVGTMFAEQITVAQALQIAGQLEQGATTADEYEVVGYVTAYEGADADGGWAKYNNQRFWIADEKGTAASNADGALEIYQGVPTEMVYVGDKVSVKATLTNYNGLLETTKRGVVTILEKVDRPVVPEGEEADVVFGKDDFAGKGTATTGSEVEVTKNGVTFWCDKAYGDGQYGVRCYKNGKIRITSADEQIGKMVFVFGLDDTGGLDEVLVVNTKEWEYTLPSRARFNSISIFFGEYEEIPEEEPITVAEALAIAKAMTPEEGKSATTVEKYAVIGYVVGISAKNENTFYLADEVDAYGEFEAYKCSSVDREVSVGDLVIVTGKIQTSHGKNSSGEEYYNYEISGGKLVHFGYTITIIANNGNVTYPLPSDGKLQLTATPDYGYHFVKWSDGNTDNPRAIELTCDTTFTAEFAPNQYTLSLQCNENQGTVEGAGVFDYLTQVQISATPAYGYHFSSWSDGNTDNPRTYTVTKDVTITANFAPNKYSINVSCNAEQGSVTGSGSYNYLSNRTIEATSNYGYHFKQWSDGNTDNPRTFELKCDTTFTALFALNQYTLSLLCDNNQGTVEGAGVFDYLTQVQISATPVYGYHFSSWSDGNTANPRTYSVTKDVTLTANFAPNKYSINVSCNAEQGSVTGSGSYNYLSNRTIEATSNYGYHFKQWSDGNTDNPRTIELRQDTTLEAIFAVDKYGTCGDNLQLTWRYDTGRQTLTISGEGDLTTNMRYGVEAVKEMRELVIEDGVGVIGNEAFANIKTLNTITLGKDVRKLQERVFYNCYNLTAIYNYRKTPASATSNTFEEVDKYACTIYVLAGSEEMFRSATGWKDFYSILAIGATETTVSDNKVTVEPSDNSATVTWPVSNEAASYTIDITKDGVVFCRLTFNANGQLTGIAFAPGRDGQSMAPAAVMTANGLQFTVTGLNSGTQYGYSVTAKDANEQPIATYSGNFTTTSEGVPTGIGNTAVEPGITKILRNGEVLILRDGKTYTLQGVEVK